MRRLSDIVLSQHRFPSDDDAPVEAKTASASGENIASDDSMVEESRTSRPLHPTNDRPRS
jgi:hypothetical protein